jgi:AglB-like glycosylation protein
VREIGDSPRPPVVSSRPAMDEAGPHPDRQAVTRLVLRAALLLVALAVAAAVRLAPWGWVFGGGEVRIAGDGDVLYHLLQAGRLVGDGLGAIWRDPYLNYPLGADVPWPPLFDGLLAGAGWLAAGGAPPDAAAILLGAVWVPVVLGVLMVALVAWLGRALLGGADPWLDAALVLALLPSHAGLTPLGRADQHALEPILLGLLLLAAARLARSGAPAGRGGAAALLGLGSALAFWNWNGSALYLALLAGFAAAWHAAAAPGEAAPGRTAGWLAAALAGGAALLAGSVALLGPAAALGTAGLSGLTGLQPALVAGTALACATVAAARRWRPGAGLPERLATGVVALLLPPALLLLIPWSSDGLTRGLTMLGAGGWYRSIQEFRPLAPSGTAPLSTDLLVVLQVHGLTPLAVLAALPLAWRRWRGRAGWRPDQQVGEAERGPALLFAVVAGGVLVLGWARNRFGVYLAIGEALSTALVARQLAAWVGRRWPGRRLAGPVAGLALAALLVAPVLPGLPGTGWVPITPTRYTDLQPLARLAGQVRLAPGRQAVLAPWNLGHDLRYGSGLPVVSSPFGVEGGEGALAADAAFHRATDQAAVEALLAARRVGLVVVSEPLAVVVSLEAFAPPGAVPVTAPDPDSPRVDRVLDLPAFRRLVATRLWLWDGMWGDADGRLLQVGLPALDAFRLVGESASLYPWRAVGVPLAKLFQPVEGARVQVRGVRPGARVEAWVTLVTDRGRQVAWSTRATADAAGLARLRLPYASGSNGAVQATRWHLSDGQGALDLAVTERAVLLGEPLEVALGR